jgi:hypothetical protein
VGLEGRELRLGRVDEAEGGIEHGAQGQAWRRDDQVSDLLASIEGRVRRILDSIGQPEVPVFVVS